jgi:hypothetical protein
MDQAVVIRPRFEPGRRIIAVSDVHGNLDFFRGLMDQVGLTPSDILVLVGDLLEKGQPRPAAVCDGAVPHPHRLPPVRQL